MYAEEDYLMLSGVQHFAFCRRQWALIHIEQQWAENYRTTAGELFHKNAHEGLSFEKRGNLLIVRGLRIASSELGISGICDVVEFHSNKNGIKLQRINGTWNICPVEYKVGEPKDGNEDEVQLCAQAMCMEEMFLTTVPEGFLYYGKNRRRKRIEFTNALKNDVRNMCLEMHQLFQKGYTPKVKTNKKCRSCSLYDLCVPKLTKTQKVSTYINQAIADKGESDL